MDTAIGVRWPDPEAPRAEVAEPFKWRDRKGHHHEVPKMETRHLFYTLRMIWNHTMPRAAHTGPFRHYTFGMHHTGAYMKRAIKAIVPELASRTDIRPEWQEEIDAMVRWTQTPEIEVFLLTQPKE